MNRRDWLAVAVGALGATLSAPTLHAQARPFDVPALKAGYLRRLRDIRQSGMLPVFDIESSYNPLYIDLPSFVSAMDKCAIAIMALSVDQPGSLVQKGQTWSDHNYELVAKYPDRFLPVGNGGNHPAWTRNANRFLDDNERAIIADRYPLMGEFEFRHYPSPRQVERGENDRDVNLAIDGPEGNRLFAFAARTGIPFQIHYEIEDALLPPLESMLARYPAAKVIWCHVGQVRWAATARRYNAAYLRSLFTRFSNLYVDTAFGGPNSIYPTSRERHARIWADDGDLKPDWKALIQEMPWRFLAALDIGGDRMTAQHVEGWSSNLRRFLGKIPDGAREIVAYRASWKLLFGEDPAV